MTWSLDFSYGEYPEIEDQLAAMADESLDPHGPGQLFDLVAGLGLPAGTSVLDVGCGEGTHARELATRFGFEVTGIDPVPRHVEVARDDAGGASARFELGTAEDLPVESGSIDLIWCRDMLVHVDDLTTAYREFARVLAPGGHAVIYQMFGTDRLEPAERDWLWRTMGVVAASAEPTTAEATMTAAGFVIDQRLDIGTEWGEFAQERTGAPGQRLLRAARLLRSPDRYVQSFGQAAYDLMLGDCLWHVYAMIGKLTRRAYVLSRPAGTSPG